MLLLRSLFALLLLAAFAPTVQAQVTITVEGLVGTLPDADPLALDDTDGFVEVFVEGSFVGQTSVIIDNNSPIWPESFSILLVLDANVTPTATIDLSVYDDDGTTSEFLGAATYEYDWVSGATVSTPLPFSGPAWTGEIGIRVSSVQEPVSSVANSFGALKSLFD